MGYDVVYNFSKKNKMDYKNIIIVVAIIMFVILLIAFIIYKNKKAEIKRINEEKAEEIERIIADKEEEERIKKEEEEKLQKRFIPLNEEELDRVEKIYTSSETKRVFLTFDDGPTEQVTPFILNLLKEQDVKATFFVLGSRVEQNPELVKQEYEEGHFVANHGYSHVYSKIYSSTDAVLEEYNRTNDLIRDAVGVENYNSMIFRFPGGSTGGYYSRLKKQAIEKLKENGIGSVDWNALTKDAEGANTQEKILANFYDTIQDKSSVVLLMHDAADKILTYEALPEIITYFKENGFEFQTMYDVIGRK